jgi:tetratricopeptide (TPR) repeat protein
MAQALELLNSPEPAEEAGAQALFLAKTSGDPLAMAEVLSWEHVRRRGTSAVRERADIAAELLRHAQRAGRHDLQLSYSYFLAADLATLGHVSEWEREIADYARQAERLKSPQNIALAHRARATRALMRGNFSEARTRTQDAFTLLQHCDRNFTAEFFTLFFALELETAGATPMLFEVVGKLEPRQRATGELMLFQDMGRAEQMQGRIPEVLPYVRKTSRAIGGWQFLGAVLADAAAYLNDTDLAEELLDRFEGFEKLQVFTGFAAIYSGPFWRYIGLLQGTLGRARQALESLEAALESVRSLEARPMEARIQLDLAALRGRRSEIEDRARAAEHAREALRIAEQLGMLSIAQRARALA